MNKKDAAKIIREKNLEHQLRTLDANKNRAHAVSIGMSGSGTTEITMRGEDGTFLWNIYQPAQVIEFIHQLAASVGCHIHIQPRNDFASWRDWKEPTKEEKLDLNGFPPFAGQKVGSEKIGILSKEEKVQGLDAKVNMTEKENVATKKAVNKRTTK